MMGCVHRTLLPKAQPVYPISPPRAPLVAALTSCPESKSGEHSFCPLAYCLYPSFTKPAAPPKNNALGMELPNPPIAPEVTEKVSDLFKLESP